MTLSERLLLEGEGILRLKPTWVYRSFCRPGKRIKLHPDDYYCKGTCYGMTRTLISKVIAYLRKGYIDLSDRLEDSTISMVSALVSDAGKVKIHNAMSADRTDVLYCMFNDQLRQYPDVIRSIKGFIDCGDILYTRHYDNPTAAKREAMSFVFSTLQQPSVSPVK